MTTPKLKPPAKQIDQGAQPYTGPLTFDVTSIGALLVHLAPGATRGFQHEKAGVENVIAELGTAMPGSGKAAGVSPDTYQTFVDLTDKLDKIRQHGQAIALIAQVFEETEAWLQHQREQVLGQITDAVQSTAKRKKNDAIVKPFQTAINYKKQTANKGVKTRQRNAAAKAEASDGPTATAAAPPPAAAPKPTGT